MGIYDREYYRGESRGASFFSVGSACKTLIIINVVVFFVENASVVDGDLLRSWFGATSESIFRHGHVWKLLTAAFLHANLLHLIGNMYFLWVFGREMEAMYGQRDFYALYLSAAVVSTLGWAAVDELTTPHGQFLAASGAVLSANPHHLMLGASGAVLAVVVLYVLYFPRRELLFMFVIPVEVWLLLTIYLGFNLYMMISRTSSQTAFSSHLAGAAYGFLFKKFDLRWSRLPWAGVRRPRLRIVQAEPPREKSAPRPATTSGPTWQPNSASQAKPAATAVVPEEQLDARLDEVLAKIAREGRSGLTEDENRILQEASRRARNRRSDRL